MKRSVSYMKRNKEIVLPPSPSVAMSRSALSTLAVLESFDGENVVQSLAEISRRLSIPKATALRILRALEARGFVDHNKSSKLYSLAPKVLTLAEAYWSGRGSLEVQRQTLPLLSKEAGETAHVSVLSGSNVIYIDIVKGPQQVSAFLEQYEGVPAYCAASGKAILAYSDPLVVDGVLEDGLPQRTSSTITTRNAFLAELQQVKQLGYAISSGEWVDDVVAVSVPLFSGQGQVLGALGLALPKSRSSPERISELAQIAKRYAGQI